MHWLNYRHLLYFWTVAREGSVSRAAESLHLSQPTVSGQLRRLERSLGIRLFQRRGRTLVLTEEGRMVFRYADQIFTLGNELQDAVQGRPVGRPMRLIVGTSPTLAKTIVYRLLQPALHLPEPVQIIYEEGDPSELLARLAVNALDVVLTDVPASPHVKVRVFNHLLGECGLSFMAAPALAARYRRNFPRSLHGAPMLLPSENSALRRLLDLWFYSQDITPLVRGELADSSVLKVFGAEGVGIFAIPTVIEKEVMRQYGVHRVGRLPTIRERFYAISVERQLQHPAVVAITRAARTELFASER
ncbi:MAG: transcriptional activator NhaR [Pirellulales bacterium]|nr:transcriptional activator NhaR [Pirellulales bacterium]